MALWVGLLAGCVTLVAGDSDSTSDTDSGVQDSPADTDSPVDTDVPVDTDSATTPLFPAVLRFPYAEAGAGAQNLQFEIENPGDVALPLEWSLSNASFELLNAPSNLAAGGVETVEVRWLGAAVESIASASLSLEWPDGTAEIHLFAVAGDPQLPDFAWSDFESFGEQATAGLPKAPFPDDSASWSDDTVLVFLPSGFRDRTLQDVVLHFHGHNSTVSATVDAHHYREQLWASGQNAILIVPQGPVNASSGNFGKLMDAGGVRALVDEVLIALYRDNKIQTPLVGDVFITAHSGGYQAAAAAVEVGGYPIAQVGLFDALYGEENTFKQYVLEGGRLRSNYTSGGGTDDNNLELIDALENEGVEVHTAMTDLALISNDPIVAFVDSSHTNSTESEQIYAEQLRWGLPRSRSTPRIEVRTALPSDETVEIVWTAPAESDLDSLEIQGWSGSSWDTLQTVGAAVRAAEVALAEPTTLRIRGVVPGQSSLASDAFAVAPNPDVLVVAGFDRLDGSFGELTNDFAAQIGRSTSTPAFASHEAVVDGEVDLSAYAAVVWCLGDEGSLDIPFTAAEQAALEDAVAGGTVVVASGSEIGYVLRDDPFLETAFGADYSADDAQTTTATGTGPLSDVGTLDFGSGAYPEEYPDVLIAKAGAEVLAQYSTGGAAVVGTPGRGALVGFPLELLPDDQRSALIDNLLDYLMD